MYATLTVPVLGTRAQRIQQESSAGEYTLPLRPLQADLERNDHNSADALGLSVDWTDAGVDPRLLADGVLTFYLGQADDFGAWDPGPTDMQFIGMLRENDGDRQVDSAGHVSLNAIDFTTLFLEAKPFGSRGIPDYSQTLREAWARVCSQTPGAEKLSESILFLDVDGNTKIGDAVAQRFQRLGQVPTKTETDGWAVWQQCVGMLGLISYFRLDTCVVTTSTAYYTEQDPPVLIWGKNLLRWSENRNAQAARKGIGLTSFDPIAGTTLEAYYPPVGDPRVKRKTSTAKKRNSASAAVRQSEDREYLPYPGVTNQIRLDEIAQRVWEERSRQELAGSIETAEMRVDTASGRDFDLLTLGSGEAIKIQVDQESRQILASLGTAAQQWQHLVDRGYSHEAADLIVLNYQEFAEFEPVYHVKGARVSMSVDRDGGSFRVGVDYCNRIQVAR
jgi:hypothetical protein